MNLVQGYTECNQELQYYCCCSGSTCTSTWMVMHLTFWLCREIHIFQGVMGRYLNKALVSACGVWDYAASPSCGMGRKSSIVTSNCGNLFHHYHEESISTDYHPTSAEWRFSRSTLVPSQTIQSTLSTLTSVPPWITQTVWSFRLSMTLYGLAYLDSIFLLPCHSLTSTCTRLTLRDPVLTPLGPLDTAPHSFLWILYLTAAWTSTFPKCTAFGLWPLSLYYTINLDLVALLLQFEYLVISSCHVVLSSHHCPYTYAFKFHLSSWLPHSTFLSVPPKLILDLELWMEL